MSSITSIEWADSTFNPWIGCTRVSPACDHCYAAVSAPTRALGVEWGAGRPRHRTGESNWKQPLRWNARPFWQCLSCGWRGDDKPELRSYCPGCASGVLVPARRRVFCASLADVFDNEVDPQWRADLFALVRATPNLDWLLLTKRIGNVARMVKAAAGTATLPDNVWLGATIANQDEADRDIPKLLEADARVRFLSMEPLLGPVNISCFLGPCSCWTEEDPDGMPKNWVDWVIVGGESGTSARPMHPAWVLSLRDQCAVANVPFLFKQWGEWAPHQARAGGDEGGDLRRGNVVYMQGDGREPDGRFIRGDAAMAMVGKHTAGRELDGRYHNGYPNALER